VTSQEKYSDINTSGFNSNFSGPKINSGRIKGVCHTAVSPFSDDHKRPQQSEKREIHKLKMKIEERDECIMGLVKKINQIEKSVNNLSNR
jgi:hypothetical protein